MTERHRYSVVFTRNTATFTVGSADPETFPLDTRGVVRTSLDSLSWYAAHTKELDCDERLLELLGRCLFEFLFANHSGNKDPKEALRNRFVDRCAESSVQLVLHFTEDALALAHLPWEFLWVPIPSNIDAGRLVVAMDNVKVTLSRAVTTQQVLRPVTGLLTVLHATFAGSDQAPVRIDRLQKQLTRYQDEHRDKFQYVVVPDASWTTIREAIERHKPHIFHFSGHGEQDAIWLATAQDPAELAEARSRQADIRLDGPLPELGRYREQIGKIAQLFDAHRPALVILDACSSDTFATAHQSMVAHALVGTVPAVIAMRYDIGDPAAVEFCATLYDEIVYHGHPLDEAVQRARYKLVPHGQRGFSHRAPGTPVLYLRESQSLCGPLQGPGIPDGPTTEAPTQPCPWCAAEDAMSGKVANCYCCGIWFRCADKKCREADPFPYPKAIVAKGPRLAQCCYCGTDIPPPRLDRGAGADETSAAPSKRPSRIALVSWDPAS